MKKTGGSATSFLHFGILSPSRYLTHVWPSKWKRLTEQMFCAMLALERLWSGWHGTERNLQAGGIVAAARQDVGVPCRYGRLLCVCRAARQSRPGGTSRDSRQLAHDDGEAARGGGRGPQAGAEAGVHQGCARGGCVRVV